jgi:outer membrane lipoprotein-sorting protein
MDGAVMLAGKYDKGFEQFMFDVSVKKPSGDEYERFTIGSDGTTFYLVDPSTKKAHEDANKRVLTYADQTAQRVAMVEYLHPTPFSDEINAAKVELKESQMIGEEDCYVVHVKYRAERPEEAEWCFSKKDFLPRQVIRIQGDPSGTSSTMTLTVTDLVADPEIDKDTFKLALPEGFEKTSKSAPLRKSHN